MENIEKALRVIRALSICSICLDQLTEEVINCTNGHIICAQCKEKLVVCPTCRTGFLASKQTWVSQILEALPLVCRNSGCEEFMFNGDGHEYWCWKRQIQCKFGECPWVGAANKVINHVKDQHGFGTSDVRRTFHGFTIDKDFQKSLLCLHCHDALIWRSIKGDTMAKKVIFSFACTPLKKPEGTFYAEIKFLNGKSLVTTRIMLETDSENVMTFHSEMLRPFVNKDRSSILNYDLITSQF